MNEADEEAQMVRLQEIVKEELEKGAIEDFGRTHLYYHFCALGHGDVDITVVSVCHLGARMLENLRRIF